MGHKKKNEKKIRKETGQYGEGKDRRMELREEENWRSDSVL